MAAFLLAGCVAQRVVTYQGVKNQNEIILKYKDDAYRTIGRDLVAQGFVIESNNKEFGQVVTAYHKALNTNIEVQVVALVVDDTTVKLSGKYNVDAVGLKAETIERYGMGGSLGMQSWNELVYVAEQSSGVIE